ncbi:hypothetical protein PAMP_005588 [Pampus punctatissimus]
MAAHSNQNHYFVREIERNDGSTLRVKQCYMGDVGCVVWDAAIVLAKYLETNRFYDPPAGINVWAGSSVVELGAGTGAVGVMAATLGAHVTVTDLQDLQNLLTVNIKENQTLISSGSITAKLLEQNFTCEEIPSSEQDPEFSSPDIHILHIRRKV